MAETNKQDVCTPKILSKNKASRGRSNTLAYSLRDRSTKDGTATKSKTVLGEVQLTPGLGRHGRSVSKKTPLKRGLRVETGVCGETVPLRTPRKREKPRMKKIWESSVEEIQLQMPATDDSLSPTPLVIKTNPLFAAGQTNRPPGKLVLDRDTDAGQVSAGSDSGRNPLFYGQRRNIRKTKEQEMITAILDLVQYGERSVKKNSRKKSIVQKAKAILGRRKSTSDIKKQKSPIRKGAFFLRAPTRTKDTARQRQTFSP